MKALLLLLLLTAALMSCASTQNASVADYNGDGVISNAEYQQFNKQKDIEDRNVYSESVKRRNVTNTMRDTSDTLYHARRAQSLIKSF